MKSEVSNDLVKKISVDRHKKKLDKRRLDHSLVFTSIFCPLKLRSEITCASVCNNPEESSDVLSENRSGE